MRGIHGRELYGQFSDGITPAHAGNTTPARAVDG